MYRDVPNLGYRCPVVASDDGLGGVLVSEHVRSPDDGRVRSTNAVQHYISLDRAASLELGIEGADEAANAERLNLATKLLKEYNRIDNDAYASAHWIREPNTARPFAIDLIIKHHGSVEAVVDDGDLRDAIRDHLGYQPREEFIDDEDGQRWTWFDGGRSNPYVQTEIDVALVELKSQLEGVPKRQCSTTSPLAGRRTTRRSTKQSDLAKTW